MALGGTAGTSKTDNPFTPRGAGFRLLALAIAGAAGIGLGATHTRAAAAYAFNSFTAGAYDWSTGSNWTATGAPNAVNFPGGDPTVLDDIAAISFNGAGPTGAVIINLSNATPTVTLSGLTLSLLSGTASDTLTLNLNSNVSVTGNIATVGGAGSGNKNGKVNLNIAAGATLTVGGVLSTSGSDGNGAAGITINGALTSPATQLRDDGDNFTTGTNAGSVNLGNFTLLRSASSSISTSSPGLHLNGGTVSAADFTIGTGNSSGVAVVAGANLTISGSFIVGDPQSGAANTSRPNTMFQTSGTVTATAASGLSLGAATPVTAGATAIASAGSYLLSGGALNTPMLQMTGSGSTSPSTNKATFTISGSAAVNIGSGGIVLGAGSASFNVSGNGIVAATGSWTAPYAGSVALSGAPIFQAGDASGNPFDMSFSGPFTGGGSLTKTGAGSMTLSGSSNYSGGTTVLAGTLYVNNPANSGTGSQLVHVLGGVLGGHGIISGIGGVDVAAGAHVAPGVNNVGTLTISTLTLEAGSTADFDFNSVANSMITITGSLGLIGGGVDLYEEGATTPFTQNGTYTLFNFTANATIPENYSSLQVLNSQANLNYAFDATDTAITVTISSSNSEAPGWAVDADGSWNTASNWAGNAIPAAGSVASFGTAITSPHTVTLDGNRSVTGVVFNNTSAYTIAPGAAASTLTLDNGAANATLSDLSGSHAITAPVILNSPTTITITALADTLTLSSSITGSGNLTLNGPGTLLLTGSSTPSITLNAGTLGGSGILTGSITPGSAAHTINPGLPASIGTLTIGGLATNSNTTLAFDLTSPAGPNDLLAVTGLIHFDGGTIAIASQTTTGAASVGYYKLLSYSLLTGSMAGIILPPAANNIVYTLDTTQDSGFIDLHRGYIGDANDDGKVDLTDLNVVLNNLGTANSSWTDGNFDGAPAIDLTDLNDVLNNLGTGIAPGFTMIATTAAPEPASLGLFALGATALIARRRKA